MKSVWIKRGKEAIECVIVGESSPVATAQGVRKTYKLHKISACPHCTFDVFEDEILGSDKVIADYLLDQNDLPNNDRTAKEA